MENLNFNSAIVEASELVKRGWTFLSEDIDNTLIELNNRGGKIYFSEVDKAAHSRGVWEQSDFEPAGDDAAAWGDIKDLHEKGLLFDIVEE